MHAVKKRMIYDMINLEWQTDILCRNGAKSLHDRIEHSLASMDMKQLGMHAYPMDCMLGTLWDLEHHIRTE